MEQIIGKLSEIETTAETIMKDALQMCIRDRFKRFKLKVIFFKHALGF